MASKIQTHVITDDQNEIIVQSKQPWLLLNGNTTPDEHLKKLTPKWDEATWERYLEWYDVPRPESLVRPRTYKKISEAADESLFVHSQSNADDELKARVTSFLSKLTDQQRTVINLIFWEGRSERETAELLKINHKSVHRLKVRALKKIKGLLVGGPGLRIMKGKVNFVPSTTGVKNGAIDLAEGTIPKAS